MRKFVTPVGNEGMYILDTASWRIVKPVMNKEKCVECGICLTYCPVNSIEFKSFAKDVEFVQMNVQKLQSI